ncbi:unnamed protein product [Paramecium octaurelia]|uniref:Uncharacterized protein n=1 Tax=Paramecium octaurelia TaxID=43137 RepID=A0A8S1UYM5_PAROT|nr:unnamed protein product [Paramecium octaurelia]
MSINEQELQSNVEKIVENNKTTSRQNQLFQKNEDYREITQEIAIKELQKSSLLDNLLKQIELIVDNLIQKYFFDFQNQLLHISNELYQLKSKQTLFGGQDSSMKYTPVLSKNSSFNDINDQFFFEDSIKSVKAKIKSVKEELNKKIQNHELLINLLSDQQQSIFIIKTRKEVKENFKKNQLDGNVKQVIIECMNNQYQKCNEVFETKYNELKQFVDLNNQKFKTKEAVLWTIVNENKSEMDKINAQIDKINTQMTSLNKFLQDVKENNNWFANIWK